MHLTAELEFVGVDAQKATTPSVVLWGLKSHTHTRTLETIMRKSLKKRPDSPPRSLVLNPGIVKRAGEMRKGDLQKGLAGCARAHVESCLPSLLLRST